MEKVRFLRMGVFILAFCVAAMVGASAQTFTSLFSFDGTDGAGPWYPMNLIQGTDGNFYGTTTSGGAYDSCKFYNFVGCGTIFKITPSGTQTTLYSFCPKSGCEDGLNPQGGLVQATNGNFYGTTPGGGTSQNCNSFSLGCGSVYQLTAKGVFSTVHSFAESDGATPLGGLIQGSDGDLYGTAASGGTSSSNCPVGCGTVFKMSTSGKLTTLHNFDDTDGSLPIGNLVQGSDGNFYGTTAYGGSYGEGTVFKVSSTGRFTSLYSFCSQGTFCPDGWQPYAGLIQGTDRNFYGTTFGGGVNDQGTLFKISSTGTLSTLHAFDYTDGAVPYAHLVQATDHHFYGTTGYGGTGTSCTDGCGTIYSFVVNSEGTGGTLTTLHDFDETDGANPYGGLVQSTNGDFYGTTGYGGTSANCTGGCGTFFSLSMGLASFVETNPTSGKVGTKVVILGNNLKGTTAVSFNGTAAEFKVVSDAEIRTSVPTGATTGYVTVTTPTKKLKSNVKFRVTQ